MSTPLGLFEHAKLHEPRLEHGYCVDDVSRALILLCREPDLDEESHLMLNNFLNFILKAIRPDGRCHNRMNTQGIWTDRPAVEDCWGRAVWALGVTAVHAPKEIQRRRALEGFRTLTLASTRDLMTLVFAALGAGEVLLAHPKDASARKILRKLRRKALPVDSSATWYWPEPRLRYSNGSIAEAVLLAGQTLDDTETINAGIRMLEFLIEIETDGDRFSVTPVGGRGPGEVKPGFDQQPIELAAIASACVRAWTITGDDKWLTEVHRAWLWFLGLNDVDAKMFIPDTGAGYDGLHRHGPNLNQGAESTIAMLSTAQHVQRVAVVA
ncbi:MAG TPA: hypothetical protein VGJ85_05450 [Candidatus Nanopelagicaceae bacterium]